jgi:hypothetical protein
MASDETGRLGMPLLLPAQAQKHVTINEALMRLDGLVNLTMQSMTQTTPPGTVADGSCWGVPAGATGAWAGKDGKIAIGSNGGWVFAAPQRGMRCHVLDLGLGAIHDGTAWIAGAMTIAPSGAGLKAGFAEAEVNVGTGASWTTGVVIPDGVMVIGAVARVTTALSGTLTGWRLGNAGATNRFGQGLGKAVGSWCRGLLGSPMSFYSPEAIIMTAEGGNFSGGKVRLSVHWLELRLPT